MIPEKLEKFQLFIDGEFVPSKSGETFNVKSPFDGTDFATISKASADDLNIAAIAARNAFTGSWPKMLPFDRGKYLRDIADEIRKRADEIAIAETKSSGKTIQNSKNEVGAAARVFEYYAGAMDKFFGSTIPLGADFVDFTLREAVGVVAQITPWNFPFMAAAWKVAPALASGCTVLIKPASYTPITTLMLAEITQVVGLPPGVLNVLPGPGGEIGKDIATHPLINKIAFTGEGKTGADLVKSAADDIKRVSLELGGKSPNIIFADANIEKAGKAAIGAAFGNAGQSCSARTRIIVEQSIYDNLIDIMVDGLRDYHIGDPFDKETDMGPLISDTQWQIVKNYVALGIAEGGDVVVGGDRPSHQTSGNFFEPTIIRNVTNKMRVAQEEIFGPVAVVIPFESEQEAIQIANDSVFGLNASVWTRDVNRALRVVRDIEAGMVSVNSHGSASRYSTFSAFGGVKQSGIGRELGMEALKLYTEIKNVFIDITDTSVGTDV
ncbi:MAG: Betaine aldehyde dehydrogenase [Alphaproteobacteria bacterium MarineAlpha11_Bin1]|nr:MAG: Betaine aldehyde dehydrogenase [Alphaproteobacteria bacterium MarineAlpha11_Bin1]